MRSELVGVGGVLLAAYGFFYQQVADSLRAALATDTDIRDDSAKELARDTVARGLWRAAMPLFVAAGTLTLVLAPDALTVVSSLDPGAPYDALRAAYALLTLFWSGLTALMAWRSVVLVSKLSKLR